ncbi:DUF1996 domain-containing protein [Kitasatospora sp. NPDC059408]|uniref:DUF1996 domain-containing protein n=1 Tax=Kitasatospora sp. NPDC059408 TaxID=3346823 RepID=UPI00367F64B6
MHRERDHHRLGGVALPVGVLLCLALGLSLLAIRLWPAGPEPAAGFVDITAVAVAAPAPPSAAAGPDASTGSYAQDCGRNQEGHRNADNVVISPGTVGGAHHVHDYVGNLSTDADSTDDSLAAAATTCTSGDRSTYYWPVLRRTDGAAPRTTAGASDDDPHGNTGEILTPDTVTIEYLGNPWAKVVPMPRFLRLLEGDPTAATDGGADAGARWGCTGFAGRTTTDRYPLCPAGSLLTRTLDFPSCWDGRGTDSSGHRSHVRFPDAAGVCPHDTFPVPHLRVTVGYRPPPAREFALDAFPEQHHSPLTDHAVFIGLMTDRQMAAVVACLNQDRTCRESG